MPIEILMPALSPTMEEGKLAKWLKSEGDAVSAGDVIAEIETDKATMEFEAVDEGTLAKIVVDEGTEGVKVNELIAVLLEEGESPDDIDLAEGGGGAEKPPETAPAEAPPQAEPQGGYGRGPDPSAEKAPEKAETKPAKAPEASEVKAPPAPRKDGERIFASPLARRIAKERGLDLTTLKGSGPHGRIVRADVESAEPKPKTAAAEEPAEAAPVTVPESAGAEQVKKMYSERAFEEVTLDGMRRTIAQRLGEAKATIPHFYLRRDIELDALLELRCRLNAKGEARGIKLSVNDFVIKALALALQEIPDANAVWAGDRILKLSPSDVAVAVAIDGGLFTPVIRDAEIKPLSKISAEMKDLAARARERKLAPHEYQGGSTAVSNLGMYGIDNFDAVINPPHGSILAVGAGVEKPVVTDGKIRTATVMSATLSVDHRVIDGALGAQLLDATKRLLEDPMTMLM